MSKTTLADEMTMGEQERQLILSVIWILERLRMQVEGLRCCKGMTPERIQGQQDALDLIEESVVCAKSITDRDILRALEYAHVLERRGDLDDGWEVSDVQDRPTEGGAIQVRLARVEYKVVGLMIDEEDFRA